MNGPSYSILEAQLPLMQLIQTVHGPFVDSLMRSFSFFGEENFYLILLPCSWVLWNWRSGARLTFLLFSGLFVTSFFKDLIQQPRPFQISKDILMIAKAGGYAMPSGHAVTSLLCLGYVVSQLNSRRDRLVQVLLLGLIFGVGFSRVYLGTHFFTDVAGGWVIGGILLLDYLFFHAIFEKFLGQYSLSLRLSVVFFGTIVIAWLMPTVVGTLAMGALQGLGFAIIYRLHQEKTVGEILNSSDTWKMRFILGVVSSALVISVSLALEYVFPKPPSPMYMIFNFLRYMFVTFWMGVAVPHIAQMIRIGFTSKRLGALDRA